MKEVENVFMNTVQNKYQKDFYKKVFDISLDMRIKLSYDEIINVVDVIGGYNEFVYESVKLMMEQIDALIPRAYYNENNPNNGTRAYEMSIGREGSMVIYYNLHSYNDIDNKTNIVAKVRAMEKEIKKKAHETGLADECDMTCENDDRAFEKFEELGIRIWWD